MSANGSFAGWHRYITTAGFKTFVRLTVKNKESFSGWEKKWKLWILKLSNRPKVKQDLPKSGDFFGLGG